MPVLVLDSSQLNGLLAERRRKGIDRWDEMWEGVLHMPPPPETEHQRAATRLLYALVDALEASGRGTVLHNVKVAEHAADDYDYRAPDIAVVLKRSKAKIRRQGIEGGPDFLVEIYSPGDETYEKIDFYAALGVRELLVVHRDTKHLELYRLSRGKLRKVQEAPDRVRSRVLPLEFERTGRRKPYGIRVVHADGRAWRV